MKCQGYPRWKQEQSEGERSFREKVMKSLSAILSEREQSDIWIQILKS